MDKEKLRQIKSCFRRSMNADIQDVMRQHGVQYKLNFGVPAPQIKGIASQFEADVEDATYLWNEDVRESKILATYLFPPKSLTIETALTWITQIKYTEIADQICMNLLVHCDFTSELIMLLLQQEEPISRYVAYRLQIRCIQQNQAIVPDQIDAILQHALVDLESSVSYLYQASFQFIERIAETNPSLVEVVLGEWKAQNTQLRENIYQSICFWID